jgi:hypothetical protein
MSNFNGTRTKQNTKDESHENIILYGKIKGTKPKRQSLSSFSPHQNLSFQGETKMEIRI